jgi:hypothetical protein
MALFSKWALRKVGTDLLGVQIRTRPRSAKGIKLTQNKCLRRQRISLRRFVGEVAEGGFLLHQTPMGSSFKFRQFVENYRKSNRFGIPIGFGRFWLGKV